MDDIFVDKPLRLLCIDDEARITRALKALFRDCQVEPCNDPRQAVAMAAKFDPDVVICDQRMPQMQGVDVLREMKTSAPRTMRILLTGYADLKAVLGSVNSAYARFCNRITKYVLRIMPSVHCRSSSSTKPVW